jgi:transcriptional regulator with XRE-family HTH domain
VKIPIESVADIGQVIRITRISQDLDQLTAAQLSTIGQSFLSHLENGKETAQIGKVLQVLKSLGICSATIRMTG